MEKSERYLRRLLTLALFMMIYSLTGCARVASSPAVTSTSSLIETTAQPLLTATIESLPSPNPTPSIQPSPTLTIDQAIQEILLMIRTNGQCRFPCIWGLTPGVSTKESIEPLYSLFSAEYSGEINHILVDKFDDLGGITLISRENDVQMNIDMSYYFKGQNSAKLVDFKAKSFNVIESGIDLRLEYIFGNDALKELVNYFTMAHILNEYGSPSSILIAPYYVERPELPHPSWIWYSVVLIYEDQGILAEYIMPRRWIGNNLAACADQVAEITVIGWDPQQEVDLREILSIESGPGIHKNNISYFKTLEEATSLSISEFTEIFSDPDTEACVFTPLEMWPHPTIPD